MQEAVRKQYLKAMGVDVWVRRSIPIDELPQGAPIEVVREEAAPPLESPAADLTPIADSASTTDQAPIVEDRASITDETTVVDPVPVTGTREILQQDAVSLTSWLGARSLMPLQLGDVSVTMIGPKDASLLVLSECAVSDKATHTPFSGRAAFLLQAMLRAIGQSFESVLQAELDAPQPDAGTLKSLLNEKSIKAVLLLVDLPADVLPSAISPIREHKHEEDELGSRVFVSFHPDYLIANPETKRLAWEDLKLVRDYLAEE